MQQAASGDEIWNNGSDSYAQLLPSKLSLSFTKLSSCGSSSNSSSIKDSSGSKSRACSRQQGMPMPASESLWEELYEQRRCPAWMYEPIRVLQYDFLQLAVFGQPDITYDQLWEIAKNLQGQPWLHCQYRTSVTWIYKLLDSSNYQPSLECSNGDAAVTSSSRKSSRSNNSSSGGSSINSSGSKAAFWACPIPAAILTLT